MPKILKIKMHPDRMLAAIYIRRFRSINQESTVTESVRNFERVQEFIAQESVTSTSSSLEVHIN
jgi:hypothetical protein